MNVSQSWAPRDFELLRRTANHFEVAVIEGALPSLRSAQAARRALAELEWLLPLHRLLLVHRNPGEEDQAALALLAEIFACACMGSHHLWQDLGLSGRDEVSRLMQLAFPELFESNRHELRWKRHLFLCLGESLGRTGLKPPKCDQCELYEGCMGSPVPAGAEAPMRVAILAVASLAPPRQM